VRAVSRGDQGIGGEGGGCDESDSAEDEIGAGGGGDGIGGEGGGVEGATDDGMTPCRGDTCVALVVRGRGRHKCRPYLSRGWSLRSVRRRWLTMWRCLLRV